MFGFETRLETLDVQWPGSSGGGGFSHRDRGASGGTLIYPKGDTSARPSGHMPKDGYFFDAIIRQPELDLDKLDPEDNIEQYTPLTDKQFDEIEDARAANASGYAVFASLTNTGLGDIALRPRPR